MVAIPCTFQDGVFKPRENVELPEGAELTLWIRDSAAKEVAHLRPQDRDFLDRLVEERAEVFRRLAE